MTDHDRLSRLFLDACRLEQEQRAAFLDEACRDDPELRREIEAMLGADGAARSGAGTAPFAASVERVAADLAQSAASAAPERIGPYRIIEILGEGGMGVVYRAEQSAPIRREVALKVLRGGFDSAAFLARFEAERQVLAAMDHPNVARVLDAGADESGRPYLAMQLLEGVPITEYTRSSGLTLRDKVRLFLDVCRGVAHAHRRGVIHRDLKPANVLVTPVHDKPVPKVIDFSIAKALAEPMIDTAFRTRAGQMIGTLEYMSPEQAAGRVDAIDTRTDVYSLGVLLYEIVTGRLPHDVTGLPLHEAVRRIVDVPPRTLHGHGDLETILAKCLEKDPERRYGSASHLVEDLERYLESRPILARPASTAYQLRKLVARHRMASAVVTLSFLFLVIFAVTVAVELRVVRRERTRAEAQARKAERVSRFMQEVYRGTGLELGHDATIRDGLKFAAQRVEQEKDEEPLARAAVLQAIGLSYTNFNEYDEGLKSLEEALSILQGQPEPDDAEIGTLYWQIALNRYKAQQLPASEVALRRALAIHDRREKEDPETLAGDLGLLGLVELGLGKLDDAEGHLRRVLRLYDEVLPQDHGHWDSRMIEQENLANVLQRRGRVGEAEAIVRDIMDRREQAGLVLGMTPFNLAFLLKRQEKCEEAETRFQAVIDSTVKTQGPRHPIVARAYVGKGECLTKRGRYEQAEADIRKGLELSRETLGEESIDYSSELGVLAGLLAHVGQVQEAEERARAAVRLHTKMLGAEDASVARDTSILGLALEAAGRLEEAEDRFRNAVDIVERSRGPGDVEIAYRLADLSRFLCRRGRFADALPLHERTLRILEEQHDEGSPELAAANGLQAWILDGLGRFDEAESYRAKSIAWIRRVLGDEHPRMAWELYRSAAELRLRGRAAEALPVVRQAVEMERKTMGERAPDVAEMLLETAEILSALGQRADAASSARQALALWSGRTFVDPGFLDRARVLAVG